MPTEAKFAACWIHLKAVNYKYIHCSAAAAAAAKHTEEQRWLARDWQDQAS